MNHQNVSRPTQRENFLMALLKKITQEYKGLLEYTRRSKPFKIVEIIELSDVPGESQFMIQITNKNCFLKLTAAKIVNDQYDLNDFNEFHAEMIRKAAQGKLSEFLKYSQPEPRYRITSKRFDKEQQQYIFTIETTDEQYFTRSASEIAADDELLKNLSFYDIYDVAYTQGAESVLQERVSLLLAKTRLTSTTA